MITPLQFGIPNSRLRYYLLAQQAPLTFAHVPIDHSVPDLLWRHIPGHTPWIDPRGEQLPLNSAQVEAPTSGLLALHIRQYLDEPDNAGTTSGIPDKVLEKWGTLFDIVLPSSRRTCCFTRGYSQLVERAGSVLQTNESLDTEETFNAFLQAKSENDKQAVQILRPLGLRYFSPSELLRLFDFTPLRTDSSFSWPTDISTKTKYRLIGNSVNVKVVQELISYVYNKR